MMACHAADSHRFKKIIILPLPILVSIVLLLIPMNGFSQGKGPEISFLQDSYDFGIIKEAKGVVHCTFYFFNAGHENLEIRKVQAGCGCTAADWTRGQIQPGDSGSVKISFDPTGKPGAFMKNIVVASNSVSSTKTLIIRGKVIPKPTDYTDTFRLTSGSLLASGNHIAFQEAWPGLMKTDSILFYNNGFDTIRWHIQFNSETLKAEVHPATIHPGGRGCLVVTMDPAKSSIAGEWTGSVLILTNDYIQPEKTITLSANILSGQPLPTLQQLFPVQLGNLLFSKNSVVFHKVPNTGARTDTLMIFNSAGYAVTLQITDKPEPVMVKETKFVIQPGDTARLILGFGGKKAAVYGYAGYGMVMIESNDSLQPQKVIHVAAEVMEDFGRMNKRKKAKAPVAQFSFTDFDFGSTDQGTQVTFQFPFQNSGRKNLIIRRIQTPMGITATCLNSDTVQPGASGVINVEFSTLYKVGYQTSEILIITNDPFHPEIKLKINGYIEPYE